jgi:hypothetical protein
MPNRVNHLEIIKNASLSIGISCDTKTLNRFYEELRMNNLLAKIEDTHVKTRQTSIIRTPIEIEHKPHYFDRVGKFRHCLGAASIALNDIQIAECIRYLDRYDVLRRESEISMRSMRLVTRTP